MDLLKRELAPVLPDAWKLIDEAASGVLKMNLAGRKLVDFKGPFGWGFAAVNTGRLELFDAQPAKGVSVGLRRVHPLLELRAPIRLVQMELDTVARGATDPDLDAVVQAAEQVARAEDSAIFNGYERAGITGIIQASPHAPRKLTGVSEYPKVILDAKEILRQAGIEGPYAVALGPRAYDEVFAASPEGYPIAKQIQRQIIDGPIVLAPAIEGGVLVSLRGGDYELTVGQDLSIGYAHHDKDSVELYLTESFTFRVLEPAAAVPIRHD